MHLLNRHQSQPLSGAAKQCGRESTPTVSRDEDMQKMSYCQIRTNSLKFAMTGSRKCWMGWMFAQIHQIRMHFYHQAISAVEDSPMSTVGSAKARRSAKNGEAIIQIDDTEKFSTELGCCTTIGNWRLCCSPAQQQARGERL